MEAGTKVYKAIANDGSAGFFSYILQGVIVVMGGGLRLVQIKHGEAMYALTPEWVRTKLEAKRNVHAAMVRYIGRWQAEADELAAEILHDELTTEEVPANGVA